MLNATFHPMANWPGKRTQTRKRSPFKGSYQKTLVLLERELNHLRASSIRIHLDIEPSEIRLDGWPRGSARPGMPGVVLAYKSKGNEFSMPCDTFTDWQTNLRAIALTLERLRAIDRYGVTQGQQYAGFRAIEAPSRWTVEQAAEFVSLHSGLGGLIGNVDSYRKAYRIAAAKLHPDAQTGSAQQFHLLGDAKGILDAHYGLARAGVAV